MEVDITDLVNQIEPSDLSASRAEKGEDAGQITWNNSLAAAEEWSLTPEQMEAWLKYIPEFGAWSDDEIASWSEDECNALFIQWVAGDLREAEAYGGIDSLKYKENGPGNVFRSDDGKIYTYVGI